MDKIKYTTPLSFVKTKHIDRNKFVQHINDVFNLNISPNSTEVSNEPCTSPHLIQELKKLVIGDYNVLGSRVHIIDWDGKKLFPSGCFIRRFYIHINFNSVSDINYMKLKFPHFIETIIY